MKLFWFETRFEVYKLEFEGKDAVLSAPGYQGRSERGD